MWDPSASFMIALAALTCAVIGLGWVGYMISATRDRLRHRVDLVALVRGQPILATAPRSSRVSDGAGWLTVTTLRGDELEFARRVAVWHIPATLATRLFLALRLSCGVVLAVLFISLALYHFHIGTTASLAGLERSVQLLAGRFRILLWPGSYCIAGAWLSMACRMQSSFL